MPNQVPARATCHDPKRALALAAAMSSRSPYVCTGPYPLPYSSI